MFRAVLTDNGAEFSDEAAIAALLGEGPGETRLFYCDPRRSDQKGACERNHVEIRKLLPKGAGIRFDRLAPADLALAMSHVNSEPRGALGFATPARAFRAMLGEDAAVLLDVSVNIIFTISTNAFSPIAPTRIRRIRQRGCAAFGA